MTDQELKNVLMTKQALAGLADLEQSMQPSDKEVAHDFFYHYLGNHPQLNNTTYHNITSYGLKSNGSVQSSFDLIMTNNKDVALVEIVYHATQVDLTRLITKKYENFKKLFPMYKDYTHHLVLATFGFYDDLKEKALAQGVTLLQRKGDVIESFEPAS